MGGRLVVIIVMISLFLLFGCLGSGSPVGIEVNTGPKLCNTTETYTEQEAYSDQDCNQVPYQDNVCHTEYLKYSSDTMSSKGAWSLDGCFAEAWTTITNMDTSESGTFTVTFTFSTLNRGDTTMPVSYMIYPGKSQKFDAVFKKPCDEDWRATSQITVPTKQVCEMVTKYREECQTVTKYRPATKTRIVEGPC